MAGQEPEFSARGVKVVGSSVVDAVRNRRFIPVYVLRCQSGKEVASLPLLIYNRFNGI